MFRNLFLCVLLLLAVSAFAVDINKASTEELAKGLKGVGESKAAAIVLYRKENGPFKTMADLAKVKGIGAATVDKNRENIELKSK